MREVPNSEAEYIGKVKVLSVVGARPQFIKLSALTSRVPDSVQHMILHTGQHYDHLMSGQFFMDLDMPFPTLNLEVGSGSHAEQTAAMLVGIEKFLTQETPDWVIAYGDTNSTVAAALAASKLSIPIAHVEAGVRVGDLSMPEEINRVMTDHVSKICLAPTRSAMDFLLREGLESRSVLVGDVMVDVLRRFEARNLESAPSLPFDTDSPFLLATLHRPKLLDSENRLRRILEALQSMEIPVFLPAHPRLVARLNEMGFKEKVHSSLAVIDPLSYPQLLWATSRSTGLITDSGGLQKEAYMLKTPCATVLPLPVWPETLTGGWN